MRSRIGYAPKTKLVKYVFYTASKKLEGIFKFVFLAIKIMMLKAQYVIFAARRSHI